MVEISLFGVCFCYWIFGARAITKLLEGEDHSDVWSLVRFHVYMIKLPHWLDCFEFAQLNASSWCTLSRAFEDY